VVFFVFPEYPPFENLPSTLANNAQVNGFR
jgi:hypothetical protein